MDHPVFIIAEAGVNHNGDLAIAKKMIDAAIEAKVDAIKFQTFKTDALILKTTPKAEYQRDSSHPDENFYDLLKRVELNFDQFKEIKKYCDLKHIIFFSTPFDYFSADLLEELNVPAYKIGSGDFDNLPFIKYLISKKKPIMISTGMASMQEIRDVMKFFRDLNFQDIVLFQCTSLYPTPFDQVNLNVIRAFQKEFPNIIIGFSDHSPGVLLGAIAVGLGAKVIEKHFTLDKNMEGPDHKASLNPIELKEYVHNIRNAEIALGNGEKRIMDHEIEIKQVARKSIISAKDIQLGEKLTQENITIKRPGTGISPKYYYQVVGKKIKKKINKNTIIQWDDLE